MQEIKKRRIVLASVLKPVNDPRMFEKIGQSLSPHYEVHIIGTKSKTDSSHDNIIFHPLGSYTRLGLDRILSPLRILKKILNLKPGLARNMYARIVVGGFDRQNISALPCCI